ncbi:MAG: CRISPR-associated helicase Cas3', partial [Desulfobacterales bacterium]|nr:CRISPR-associated helicase Cas3' [Desulfobacterales bacterium]
NDCIWVMDEVQLMGSGLATTTQLQAFRAIFGCTAPVRSVWMSATLKSDWLNTIDFAAQFRDLEKRGLSSDDLRRPEVVKRMSAEKSVVRSDVSSHKPDQIARLIATAHRKGTRTLVVVNTVRRAVDIYKAVARKKTGAALTLIHSRLRPPDRRKALVRLLSRPGPEGAICISTQVVEAGMDFSAATLITDLAPWPSLVQRFGRCNRAGEEKHARVIWIPLDPEKRNQAAPYSREELAEAGEMMKNLDNAAPDRLPPVSSRAEDETVLRRKDLLDLFDATPDLSGMDLDISRFIRDAEDHDLQVFWRDIPKNDGPSNREPAPARDELCPAPVNEVRKLTDLDMWRWDHLEKRWARPAALHPGVVLMLRRVDGGYDSELGWTGKRKDTPGPLPPGRRREEAVGDDFYAFSTWQSLADHTDAVVSELKSLLAVCGLADGSVKEALLAAARWHDAGKAHEVFQEAMTGDPPEADGAVIWAKSGRGRVAYKRRGFRHELASALAMLEHGLPDAAVYLAAAHHGKIRLSIRSQPFEKPPPEKNRRFARGVWEGDALRGADLGGGARMPETKLDLSYMELGDGPRGPSFLSRMLCLRDDPSLGPFRLAYLETLLRVADWRASEQNGVKKA